MEKLLICTFKKLNKLKKGQEILKWEVNNLCNIHVSHLLDFKKNVNIQKCIHLNQTAHDTHNFTHLKTQYTEKNVKKVRRKQITKLKKKNYLKQ